MENLIVDKVMMSPSNCVTNEFVGVVPLVNIIGPVDTATDAFLNKMY